MTEQPDAPASRRNRQPILEVISVEFRDCHSVLEIGSGTGQHAVFFGAAMPWLTWQTSDLEENHEGIRSWIGEAGLENVLNPLQLDVQRPSGVGGGEYDAAFSANTAHIMSMAAVSCMFDVVGQALSRGGVFCLYGPVNRDGEYTSDSNRRFDQSLRQQDSSMGIRDLADLDRFANRSNMHRKRLYAMPANNALAVWRKEDLEVSDGDS